MPATCLAGRAMIYECAKWPNRLKVAPTEVQLQKQRKSMKINENLEKSLKSITIEVGALSAQILIALTTLHTRKSSHDPPNTSRACWTSVPMDWII